MSPEKYPRSALAKTAERIAGVKFGPEGLTREEIARTLNTTPECITDEEWVEISEFAVNAGAELFTATVRKDVQLAIESKEPAKKLANIRWCIEECKILSPAHDIFHAAETYRLTNGESASAEFAKTHGRRKYAGPSLAAAELFPLLFLTMKGWGGTLPALLSCPKGRRYVSEILFECEGLEKQVREMQSKLRDTPAPESPAERQREYERMVQLLVISASVEKLRAMRPRVKPLSRKERNAICTSMEQAAKNPAHPYQRLAQEVFSQKGLSENPRLFLDGFLAAIRTLPRT